MAASNDRDWSLDQAILPYANIDRTLVTIHNIRNFIYRTTDDYTPGYYDKTFDLNKIKSLDYVVSPFSFWHAVAHAFLTFGFENGEHISISIEIRKKKGDVFSPFKGLFNAFEIMYVIADENDVIKLRTNIRKDKVYIYPIKASQEKIAALFVDMIKRANALKDFPEFYNTLSNSCTTNIAHHVNAISPKKIPWDPRIILAGYSDKLAYNLGLIDTKLSFRETRASCLLTDFSTAKRKRT